MKIGIIGLPNVGKSTIFNAITSAGAESANYPFCTIEPNVGVVAVPDSRLDVLSKMYHPKKVTPTAIEFVDIAGLVKGASQGEGLGNKFLAHIREVDAIAHVIRCFDNENIVHVDGKVNPISDLETINLELIFADLEVIERRIQKTVKLAKNDKQEKANLEILCKLRDELETGKNPTRDNYLESEWQYILSLQLISVKPLLFIANVDEEDIIKDNEYVLALKEYAVPLGIEVIKISAKIEEEISELDSDEKREFLFDLGLSESGLEQVIHAAYRLLGLISFLTAGEDECRAWTIKDGTVASKAAGKIHTDIERGFIRAEITSYNHLVEAGSEVKAKERGLTRIEGKDYVMQDGDITYFRFNV